MPQPPVLSSPPKKQPPVLFGAQPQVAEILDHRWQYTPVKLPPVKMPPVKMPPVDKQLVPPPPKASTVANPTGEPTITAPPPPPPPKREENPSSVAVASSFKNPPSFKKAPAMPKQPQVPLVLGGRRNRQPDVGRASSSTGATHFSWEWTGVHPTMRPTIAHWIPALRNQWDVDDDGIDTMLRLSVHSIGGYQEVVNIIVKLIKGVCDDRIIRNRSAFATRCAKNAWDKLKR